MGCCGGRRAELSQGTAPDRGAVALVYQGEGQVVVSRVPSGREYRFSQREPAAAVAPEDVASILKTGLFRLQ